MKITRQHVLFWQARRAPIPGWARQFRQYRAEADIDALINQAAGIKPTYSTRDLVPLLRLVRRNMARGAEARTMLQYLRHLENDPWTRSATPRRAAWAAKWAERISLAKKNG